MSVRGFSPLATEAVLATNAGTFWGRPPPQEFQPFSHCGQRAAHRHFTDADQFVGAFEVVIVETRYIGLDHQSAALLHVALMVSCAMANDCPITSK